MAEETRNEKDARVHVFTRATHGQKFQPPDWKKELSERGGEVDDPRYLLRGARLFMALKNAIYYDIDDAKLAGDAAVKARIAKYAASGSVRASPDAPIKRLREAGQRAVKGLVEARAGTSDPEPDELEAIDQKFDFDIVGAYFRALYQVVARTRRIAREELRAHANKFFNALGPFDANIKEEDGPFTPKDGKPPKIGAAVKTVGRPTYEGQVPGAQFDAHAFTTEYLLPVFASKTPEMRVDDVVDDQWAQTHSLVFVYHVLCWIRFLERIINEYVEAASAFDSDKAKGLDLLRDLVGHARPSSRPSRQRGATGIAIAKHPIPATITDADMRELVGQLAAMIKGRGGGSLADPSIPVTDGWKTDREEVIKRLRPVVSARRDGKFVARTSDGDATLARFLTAAAAYYMEHVFDADAALETIAGQLRTVAKQSVIKSILNTLSQADTDALASAGLMKGIKKAHDLAAPMLPFDRASTSLGVRYDDDTQASQVLVGAVDDAAGSAPFTEREMRFLRAARRTEIGAHSMLLQVRQFVGYSPVVPPHEDDEADLNESTITASKEDESVEITKLDVELFWGKRLYDIWTRCSEMLDNSSLAETPATVSALPDDGASLATVRIDRDDPFYYRIGLRHFMDVDEAIEAEGEDAPGMESGSDEESSSSSSSEPVAVKKQVATPHHVSGRLRRHARPQIPFPALDTAPPAPAPAAAATKAADEALLNDLEAAVDQSASNVFARRRWWWLFCLVTLYNEDVWERKGPVEPARHALGMLHEFFADTFNFATDENRNMLVAGPPGTGKTTFMQTLAAAGHLLGIFPMSTRSPRNVVTLFASDLIASYAGQTRPKTRDAIIRSLGAPIIIDEAYALTESAARSGGGGGGDGYGRESLNEITSMVLGGRGLVAMWLLGYGAALFNSIISVNEGLRRRFARKLEFAPYTAGDLVKVFFQRFEHTLEPIGVICDGYYPEDAMAETARDVKSAGFDAAGALDAHKQMLIDQNQRIKNTRDEAEKRAREEQPPVVADETRGSSAVKPKRKRKQTPSPSPPLPAPPVPADDALQGVSLDTIRSASVDDVTRPPGGWVINEIDWIETNLTALLLFLTGEGWQDIKYAHAPVMNMLLVTGRHASVVDDLAHVKGVDIVVLDKQRMASADAYASAKEALQKGTTATAGATTLAEFKRLFKNFSEEAWHPCITDQFVASYRGMAYGLDVPLVTALEREPAYIQLTDESRSDFEARVARMREEGGFGNVLSTGNATAMIDIVNGLQRKFKRMPRDQRVLTMEMILKELEEYIDNKGLMDKATAVFARSELGKAKQDRSRQWRPSEPSVIKRAVRRERAAADQERDDSDASDSESEHEGDSDADSSQALPAIPQSTAAPILTDAPLQQDDLV